MELPSSLRGVLTLDNFEPCQILDFSTTGDKLALSTTCPALSKMLSDSKFWTILDFRGSHRATESLKLAMNHPRISKAVTSVNLEFCKEIVDKDLEVLQGLTHLNLNALHKLTDDGIAAVAKANSETLVHFELYWHHSLGNDALVQIAKSCNKLKLLNLSGCQKIEDPGVRAIARNCSLLTDIDLTRCPLLTDDSLAFICSKLTKLRSLNLYADSQFTDKGLASIAKLSDLRFLDLCGVGKLSSKVMMDIARGCKLLESLNLTWCVNIDDAAVFVIAEHCTQLQLLSVFGLKGVTDAMLDALAVPGRCSHTLTTLDVHGCPNVKRQADALLLKQFPNLCFSPHLGLKTRKKE